MRITKIPPRLMAGALCVALAACSDNSNSPRESGKFISAVASANPNNSIIALVEVTARGIDSAFVRYWHDGGPVDSTPSQRFIGTDSVVTIAVLGLDTLTDYSLEVVLAPPSGNIRAEDTLSFTTGTYPAWIPRAQVSGTDTIPGLLLASYPDGAVITNNSGKILWYRFRPGGVLGSWQAHANGLYTWLGQADSSGYYVHDAAGNEIGRYSCVGYKTRFHDVLVQADGGVWIMCDELVTMDLTADSGLAAVSVTSTVVQHLSPAGTVLFQWRALDHFAITDIPLELRNGPAVNFTHCNGIAIDTDGNLILSSRTLDEVTKISTTTGEIIWRLGGLRNQFTLIGDTKGFFEQQHGLRVVGPNQIQMLDNGRSAPSRLVRYQIDPVAHTATLLMQFIDAPTTFTLVGGSTQVLPGGRALVSFGREGRVVEVTSAGVRAFELTGIDDIYVFRAQRIASLYNPGAPL